VLKDEVAAQSLELFPGRLLVGSLVVSKVSTKLVVRSRLLILLVLGNKVWMRRQSMAQSIRKTKSGLASRDGTTTATTTHRSCCSQPP